MQQETAIIPGSFDPPHLSHIDLIARTLRGENAPKKAVVAIVHNPTKKERLVSVENATALLRRMLPDDLRSRVIIANTGEPAPRLAQKFNATVLVRGQRNRHVTLKEGVHELLVAAYFKGHQLLTGHPIRMHWTPGPEEASAVSSSRVRAALLQDPPDSAALGACLPAGEVRILLRAAEQAGAPLSTQEGAEGFNRALKKALMSPQLETPQAVPRRIWPHLPAPGAMPRP